MEVAKVISGFSYCNKYKVGAVIVKNNQIISTGYNGTVKGFDNSCEIGNKTKDEVLHAEANAIMACCAEGISTKDTFIFITLSPCVNCAKLIIQAGIKAVYYNKEYKNPDGIKLLKKAGVIIGKVN